MNIISTVAEMQAEASRLRAEGRKIGVVPTMGYLHEGHASLIRRAKEICDVVVVTIFVNPTQFGPGEDFDRYPRDFQRDSEIALKCGADIIFRPDKQEMYPEGYKTYIEVEDISSTFEGKIRPGHFRGVATIVAKLLHATHPHIAVFGQKDAQQSYVIRQMVHDLNFDVEIVVAPIVREPDGLALSSRNVYLKNGQRASAVFLYKSLQHVENRVKSGERSVAKLRAEMEEILKKGNPTQIDYVAFVRPSTFTEIETIETPEVLIALAVRFGSTRLIDNIIVSVV
ncbi:MAG: pantoate--beta-alanine ligase [Ignavibacteriales bacterium]|nr:pantoate--beta-alanine ligase [Ignavibacteriales bacterium]